MKRGAPKPEDGLCLTGEYQRENERTTARDFNMQEGALRRSKSECVAKKETMGRRA